MEAVRLSDNVVQFRLPEPFAPFADYLGFGILPKHLLNGKTIDQMIDLNYNIQPVGSGPFRFDRLVVENGEIKGIVLKAFKDYYGQKPYIDEMVFRYYPDSPAVLQAYRDGQVQGIARVSPEILPQVLAEPKLAVYTAREPEMSMVLFNLKSQDAPFLQDPKIRRALLLGLNRQGIVDKLLNGQAVVSDGPILPDTWAYYDGLKRVEYDPDTARSLLKEAGYVLAAEGDVVRKKGDVPLRLELAYPDNEHHQAIAESIRANWNAIGCRSHPGPGTF